VTTEYLPIGVLPLIADDIGVSEGQAGLLVTLPGICAAIAAPATVVFAKSYDRRLVLCAQLALLLCSNLLVATAPNMTVVLIGRALVGVGIGGFWTIGTSLGPQLRPGKQGSLATSIILSGISLGTVAGLPAAALIGDVVGWRMAFMSTAALGACVIVALVICLPRIRPQPGSGLRALPMVLRRRRIQLALACTVLVFTGHFCAYTYITPYLQGGDGSVGALTGILIAYGAVGFLGNFAAGWVAVRSSTLAAACGAVIVGISLAALSFSDLPKLAALGLVMAWGVGFGMLPVAMQLFTFAGAPDQRESVSAIFVSLVQASVGVGALVGAFAVDNHGVARAFLIGGFLALAAVAFVAATTTSRVRRGP
jgi:predicted MFS family arabinose efflux permease